ncbi:hypothetical protein QF035_002228 [Streptomyces umbrinus]|uniref:Uncharacterized protein n=1 Tax=Streptomyces umbrinus TaxID=67370 RepID=A0ABU0SM64_9ACTN|nr:hypothetical protein [Streptomyces umbrinus]MDQ1024646.1 hypothetical protein [Streptomyces umbrinus]
MTGGRGAFVVSVLLRRHDRCAAATLGPSGLVEETDAMGESNRTVLLVESVRNGMGYKAAARELGSVVVSLYTFGCSGSWTEDHEGDDATRYASDPDTAVAELSTVGYDMKAAVLGMEAAVHLVEFVAHRPNLRGNDESLAWARRTRAAMRRRSGPRHPAVPSRTGVVNHISIATGAAQRYATSLHRRNRAFPIRSEPDVSEVEIPVCKDGHFRMPSDSWRGIR